MFEKNPNSIIENCKKKIFVLENDLKNAKENFSETTVEIIKHEIYINERKTKEAELQIKYTDYQ